MGIRDTFDFDEAAYTAKVRATEDIDVLRKKHQAKSRLILSSCGGVGAGIASVHFTLRASLIGSVYSARQVHVLIQQRDIIAAEFERRELEVPRDRKRDVAAGYAMAGAGGFLGGFIPSEVHHLAGEAVISVTSATPIDPSNVA